MELVNNLQPADIVLPEEVLGIEIAINSRYQIQYPYIAGFQQF